MSYGEPASSNKPNEAVFLIDDDRSVLESLRAVLQSAGRETIVFSSADEFVEEAYEEVHGCVIVDMLMPGMNGMELLVYVRKKYRSVPVVIMTAHADVEAAVRAMKAGAFDYVTKPISPLRLLEVVETALMSFRADHVNQAKSLRVNDRLAQLTARETEILKFLLQGSNSKEIASKLSISRFTVDNHRASILRKMGARSLIDLINMVRYTELFAHTP